MMNCLPVCFQNIVINIRSKSNLQVQDFCRKFLDNYIIDKCELLSKFNIN